MKQYVKYSKPYLRYFIITPLLMFCEVYCDVKIPALAAEIINVGVVYGDSQGIMTLSIQMLVYVALAISSGVGAAYFAVRAAVNFGGDLRVDVFEKIQEFSFANIDHFRAGSLITRLTNDISQMQQLVVMCLRMAIRAPGMLIGGIIMSYVISPKLSTVFLFLVPILILIMYVILQLSYKKFGVLQGKIDAVNIYIQEILTNIRVVKAFTRESFEDDKFQQTNEDLKISGLRAYRITMFQMPLMTLAVNFASVAIIWLGSQAFHLGEIEIGSISAMITYLMQILMSMNMLAMIFLQSSRALVSSKRLTEVLTAEVTIQDNHAEIVNTVNSGNIKFEHVKFRYYQNSEDLVLSDLNFEIPSGKTVGIIGSTGSGKSSLIHLIPRLYEVSEGSVYVDGTNVKDYTLENLRDGVAIVLQNNMLFSGTIKENLLWGNKEATMEEIQCAARWAAAEEFILKKEGGYDAIVEQGGRNFSGGQKQRLCIARALLKKPQILILDDSTSAVDTATEKMITHALHTELKNTTKIIIAQRISSVENADFIIVMEDGKIEAMGKHNQLLQECKTYQEIYHLQNQTK